MKTASHSTPPSFVNACTFIVLCLNSSPDAGYPSERWDASEWDPS